MAWTEFKLIPNEYNDQMKEIDENILKLFNERKAAANGKRLFPPMELLEKWAKQYQMEAPQISWLMHSINDGSRPPMINEADELIGVVGIMKKSVVGEVEYTLTHSMQHQNSSIVHIEIRHLKMNENIGHLRPQLMLEVKGNIDYHIFRNGSHGGGGETKISFMVSPLLPDHMEDISFALIPYAPPMENPPKEVILDQEVKF